MSVAAILKHKGCEIFAARPTDTIAEVARNLSDRSIGVVVVVDAVGTLLGMLSERDIVNALATNGAWALEMSAAQVMSSELKTVSPQTTTGQALALMAAGHHRYLPVVEGGALVGVISIGDVVKSRILQHEIEVDTLRAYVSGADYAVTSPIPSWCENEDESAAPSVLAPTRAMAHADAAE